MSVTKLKKKQETNYKETIHSFKWITKDPERFLSVQSDKLAEIHEVIGQAYQIATASNASLQHALDVLPELLLKDMDDEQIWQQLELRNNFILPHFIEKTSKLMALREAKLEIQLKEDGQSDIESEAGSSFNEEESFNDDISDISEKLDDESADEDRVRKDSSRKRKIRPSIVDDQFFKLDEMSAFLEAEEYKDMRKQKGESLQEDEEKIDFFTKDLSDNDDEDGSNPKYNDFFNSEDEINDNAKKELKKGNKTELQLIYNADETNTIEQKQGSKMEGDSDRQINQLDSDMDSVNEEQAKSGFEQRQLRLEQRMRDYEQEVLGEKQWQLKGEVQATNRPQNSLLEEVLEFESTVRPAPVVTEETTRRLEDIIRQRIKDQAWDDVERKVRPVQTPQEYRKQIVLDQEKSKESLSQIYEKEYKRELDKVNLGSDVKATEEEPKEHKEIRRLMLGLFTKLDSLSNFHFMPKPVEPEAKIITNTPALAMEEVTPVAVSDATLLAPEEVYRGAKTKLLGKSERNRADKNRERRKKKQKQRAIHTALEAKDLHRQKLGISLSKKEESAKLLKSITKHRNVEKITVSKDYKDLKSSKSFFTKLQDTTSVTNGAGNSKNKKHLATKKLSVKKLKL